MFFSPFDSVSFFDVELGVDPEEFIPPRECEYTIVWNPVGKGVRQVVGGLMILVYDCTDLNGDSCFQVNDK